MSGVLLVSYGMLWLLMLSVIVAMIAFGRQIGLLNYRLPPVGARGGSQGPAVGSQAPRMSIPVGEGRILEVGGERERALLLVFASTDCTSCERLLPSLGAIARSEERRLDAALVFGEKEAGAYRDFVETHQLDRLVHLRSEALFTLFGVSFTPYAVIIGTDGLVSGKGIANHRDHLESLVHGQATPGGDGVTTSDETHFAVTANVPRTGELGPKPNSLRFHNTGARNSPTPVHTDTSSRSNRASGN